MSDWHAQARAMKAAEPALTTRALAEHFGVTASAVWKALNPDVTKRKNAADRDRRRSQRRMNDRERAERMRVACQTCGEPCGKGSGSVGHTPRQCLRCVRAADDARAARIIALYEQGVPTPQMAEALGTSEGSLSVKLHRLRRAGRIGYRYAAYERSAA